MLTQPGLGRGVGVVKFRTLGKEPLGPRLCRRGQGAFIFPAGRKYGAVPSARRPFRISIQNAGRYNEGMSTVEEIKEAIDRLTPAERARLDALLEQEWEAWDRQIQQDADGGRLDHLLKQVDAEIAAKRLEEGP